MIIKGARSILAVIILVLLCQVFDVLAEETRPDMSSQTEGEPLVTSNIPNLAEIVPLEIQLIDRLKDLQKQLEGKVDNEQVKKSYAELEGDLRVLSERLNKLKAVQEYKYNKLVDLHEVLKNKHDVLQSLNEPVSKLIRKLSAQRKEWQTEANLWSEWQDALLNEGEFEQLRAAFDRAAKAIKTARELILSELSTLLEKQEKAGAIERQIDTLINDVDTLVAKERQITLFNVTPPMLSTQYLTQLRSENVWRQVVASFDQISLPDKRAVSQHGWIIVFQVVIALLLIVSILKRKNIFEGKERWQFLALYPISTGVFLSYVLCILVYEYQGVPHFWEVVATIIGGTAFACLMRGVVDAYWKAWAIYLLVGIVLIEGLMDAMSFPIPLYRLYICIAALTILIFSLSLAAKLKSEHKDRMYLWLLYPGALFYTGIILLESWGRKALAAYLFVSLIDTIITILAFVFFLYMIHGCIEWLFNTPLLRRSAVLDDDETNIIIKRLTRFLDALVILLVVIPATLMIWSVYQNLTEATEGVLNFGFNLGGSRVTVGLLVISAAILVGSFLLSWIVQKLLIDQVLFQRRMEKGARISIARLVHYSIMVVGFVFAISALGIEITKLTIMISALGVGIGFGLQGIVNNFVSGLVLLFEQPVRVGDLIELEGMWAEIKHIGIRSTIVRNFDHADMIIPNADLVSNQVTNWTLADREARLTIGVGVAYGSNVDLVVETLMGCARANDQVVESPAPLALFLNFGESTLDFELRVFVPASLRVGIRSMLHREIDKRFREEGITIAFPQRDIHLPGVRIGGSTEKNDPDIAAVYKDDGS